MILEDVVFRNIQNTFYLEIKVKKGSQHNHRELRNWSVVPGLLVEHNCEFIEILFIVKSNTDKKSHLNMRKERTKTSPNRFKLRKNTQLLLTIYKKKFRKFWLGIFVR